MPQTLCSPCSPQHRAGLNRAWWHLAPQGSSSVQWHCDLHRVPARLGETKLGFFPKNGLSCALLGVLPPHMVVSGHHPGVVVGCSYREVECQCSSPSQPSQVSCRPRGAASSTRATSPRGATSHGDLLQRPQMSICK